MSPRLQSPRRVALGVERHALIAYFVLAFAISWLGALAGAAPQLLRHSPLTKTTGLVMFPVVVLGPCLSAIVLTAIGEGERGFRSLFSQMAPARIPARWYAPLLIPPVLILAVLLCLKTFVSPAYTPNRFLVGILFGLPAGFLEEIGWTGYAFPKMRSHSNELAASTVLGLLWSLWHVPVINYLGTAAPHRAFWLQFFLAFALAMTAMRVLIGWLYTNTQSLLLAQFMHVISTGSLVVFSPPLVNAAQEAEWYALYGILLWIAVAVVVKRFGGSRRLPQI